MFPVSSEYLEAIRHPHSIISYADVYVTNYRNPQDPRPPSASNTQYVPFYRVGIVDGSVTADADQQQRYTADVVLNFDIESKLDLNTDLLNVYSTRIALWTGIIGAHIDPSDPRSVELVVPMGMYRVESITRDSLNLPRLSLGGLEGYVQDYQLLTPWTVDNIQNGKRRIVDVITHLINECFALPSANGAPGVDVLIDIDTNTAETVDQFRDTILKVPRTGSRWEFITELAAAIDCVVYAGADGMFHITPTPARKQRFVQYPSVWSIEHGDVGTLVSMNRAVSRDNVYNRVVVSNNSVDDNVPLVYGDVTDDDPNSPVRWGGPFGRKPLFREVGDISTSQQAAWKAVYLINDMFGANRSLSLNLVPNCALEPDDVIWVTTQGTVVEKHQIRSMTVGLSEQGDMSIDTVVKSDLKFLIWDDVPPGPKSSAIEYIWSVQQSTWIKARGIDSLTRI